MNQRTQAVEARERRQELWEAFLGICQAALHTDEGRVARSYLVQRGCPADNLGDLELGVYPSTEQIRGGLLKRGFLTDEIGFSAREVDDGKPVGAGVIYDDRWEGRLVGPWRDLSGRIISFWARDLCGEPGDDANHLYLRGGRGDVPLGLSAAQDRDLVLVEEPLDVAMLQSRGDRRVIACGGASLPQEQVDALQRRRTRSVILCLDPDGAGKLEALLCLDQLDRAGIRSYVAPALPDGLTPGKFVARCGMGAWDHHLCTGIPGSFYRAEVMLQEHEFSTGEGRREAVEALLEHEQTIEDPFDRAQFWPFFAHHSRDLHDAVHESAEKHRQHRHRDRLERGGARQLAVVPSRRAPLGLS